MVTAKSAATKRNMWRVLSISVINVSIISGGVMSAMSSANNANQCRRRMWRRRRNILSIGVACWRRKYQSALAACGTCDVSVTQQLWHEKLRNISAGIWLA